MPNNFHRAEISCEDMRTVFEDGNSAKLPAAIEQYLSHYSLCPPCPKGPEILVLADAVLNNSVVTDENTLDGYANYFSNHIKQCADISQNSTLDMIACEMKNASSADQIIELLQEQIKVQLSHWDEMCGYCLLYRNLEVACRYLKVTSVDGLRVLSENVVPNVDEEWKVWTRANG